MSEDRKPIRLPPPVFPSGSRRHPAGAPRETNDAFALISPDEPMPERGATFEEGTATGIGDGVHVGPEDTLAGGDPHVRELVAAVAKLAEALRRRGEAGLRVTPELSRFEGTLRAYCVGYLAGRRAEDGAGRRE